MNALVPPELAARAPGAVLATLRLLPVAMTSPFLGGPLVPPIVRIAPSSSLITRPRACSQRVTPSMIARYS